tara:strand:+ start:335 stop:1327 length:993 start_codon:yes stop_codon:yes gene_type:complete
MKIGAIAQHSNIGPTTKVKNTYSSETNINSFNQLVPSILNNHKLWCWFDFTDENTFTETSGTSWLELFGIDNGFHASFENIQDKGPYNATLFPVEGKSPQVRHSRNIELANTFVNYYESGQGNITYVNDDNGAYFTAPTDLFQMNSTIVMILDTNATSGTVSYLFDFPGVDGPDENSAPDTRFHAYANLKSGVGGGLTMKNTAGNIDLYANIFNPSTQIGGDDNDHFTWIYFVPNTTTNKIEIYVRGVHAGSPFAFENLEFSSTHKIDAGERMYLGISNDTTADSSFSGHIYEFIIFEEVLSKQGLLGIDSYIKRKYSQYPYGRPNKFYT